MVNFVLSFCKITGASKIFSRNFYLPLLKPLTPREAFRTFRITGKWLLGSKIQRYIPVLLNHKRKRSKHVKNYGKVIHKENDDYTYMTPVLDPENESHKLLLNILETKDGSGVFVYTVEDKKYNIVLQAQLEYAVRDGDVIDLLVSQKNDKVLIKLKNFKKIPIELDYFDTKEPMYKGEGATTEEDEKLHHYGKYTMSLAKIFEDKERMEEEWEIMLKKIIQRRRRQAAEKRKEYKALIKENMRKLDWDQFEEEAKKIVQEINEPAEEKPIDMEIDDLTKTVNVNEFFSKNKDLMDQLPTIDEISDVLKNMNNAILHELICSKETENENGDVITISGIKVTLSSGREIFVSGQMVLTEDGEVFVPGQTIKNEFGLEYTPGFTVNIDNKPTLLSGLIMAQNNSVPMFLPTHSTITADGQLTFANEPEERPPPPTEERIQIRKERRKQYNKVIDGSESEPEEAEDEEEKEEINSEHILIEIDENIDEDLFNFEDSRDDSESSVDLGYNEIDLEVLKQKQEEDKAELERLKRMLQDDGMDKLVLNLEDKKLSLQQRLEELRKLTVEYERSLITYATEKDANAIATRITKNTDAINRLSDILLVLTRKMAAFRDRSNIYPENIAEENFIDDYCNDKLKKFPKNLKISLKNCIVAANNTFKIRPKDQVLALNTIGDIFVEMFKNNELFLLQLLDLMNTPVERSELCDILLKELSFNFVDSKINILYRIVDKIDPHDNIKKILKDVSEIMGDAYVKLIKTDEIILNDMLKYCKENLNNINSVSKVNAVIQSAIVNSVRIYLDNAINEVCQFDCYTIKEFQTEAINFARAFELIDIANSIENINFKNIESASTKEFLKQILLIRKLTEKDFTLKKALERMRRNPHQAIHDPRIRQLIQESALLLSKQTTITNSKTIPLNLMKTQNSLAVENYLLQRMVMDYPILIMRDIYEVVIPKDSAQAVSTGRVPYTLIDECGISNFKPLHSLNALKENKNYSDQYRDNSYKSNDNVVDNNLNIPSSFRRNSSASPRYLA